MGQVKGYRHSEEAKAKMSASHRGLEFSSEHKENHLRAVRIATSKPEYREAMRRIKTGKAMPLDSRSGASEKNKNAKAWLFIKNQTSYTFTNLNKFVRDNKHLFSLEDLTEYRSEKRVAPIYRATVMLRNLHLLKPDGTPVIPNHEWNGWTIGEKYEGGNNGRDPREEGERRSA